MGMICSMQQSPGQRPGLRLFKKDVTEPQVITFTVLDRHLNLDDIYIFKPEPITSTSVKRLYMGPGVTRVPIRTGRIRGTLFIPKGT